MIQTSMSVNSMITIATVNIIFTIIIIIMVLHPKFATTLLEALSVFVHLATSCVMSHTNVYVSWEDYLYEY